MSGSKTNESYNLKTCIAHVALSLSSLWALKKTSCCLTPYAFSTYGFIFAHSVAGILNFGSRETFDDININCLYQLTSSKAILLPMPMIATEIGRFYDVQDEYAILPVLSIAVPIIAHLTKPIYCETIFEVAILISMFTSIYTAYTYDANVYVWSMIAFATQNHYMFSKINDLRKVDAAESHEISAIGLAFHCLFTAGCLHEAMLC